MTFFRLCPADLYPQLHHYNWYLFLLALAAEKPTLDEFTDTKRSPPRDKVVLPASD